MPQKKIIEILKARRIELGWSQWTLAQVLDKSQNTVWQWESGTVDPRAHSLDIWAAALGMEIRAYPVAGWTPPENPVP